MNTIYLKTLLSLLSLINLTHTARILGIFPSPFKSHVIIHSSIAETLAAAGHNVTVMGSFDNPIHQAKYRYIHLEGPKMDSKFVTKALDDKESTHQKFYKMMGVAAKWANSSMQHPEMKDFLQNHKAGDFDLLILGYFINDFLLGLGAHFQCPIIVSFMIRPIFAVNTLVGNPEPSSYVPTVFTNVEQPMKFKDRLRNFLANWWEHNVMERWMRKEMQEMYR